jgi:hypothetical protein
MSGPSWSLLGGSPIQIATAAWGTLTAREKRADRTMRSAEPFSTSRPSAHAQGSEVSSQPKRCGARHSGSGTPGSTEPSRPRSRVGGKSLNQASCADRTRASPTRRAEPILPAVEDVSGKFYEEIIFGLECGCAIRLNALVFLDHKYRPFRRAAGYPRALTPSTSSTS